MGVPLGTMSSASTTFLFAEPANSLKLWEQNHAAIQASLPRFRHIMQQATAAYHGLIFNQFNDSVQAAFPSAPDAVQAALEAQRQLITEKWGFPMQTRLALLTGSAQREGSEFLGQAPHRAARMLSIAHGGQVLLCHITAGLVSDSLPNGVTLLDLGKHRLPDLTRSENIYQLCAPGLPENFPPIKSIDNQPTNLPTQPYTLVGRQVELQVINQLLRSEEVHLLTLTGTGGTGKTRLALQSAADLLGVFPDGVFFVALDQIGEPALVASSVAQALSLELTGNQSIEDELTEQLRKRNVLLVLDNFEHVLPAASLVSGLLAACPQLKVIATSREPLRLRGEREFPVSHLPLPSSGQALAADQLPQFASVALFIQRAQAARPSFAVDSQNAAAVAEICIFLDGLPLAIELVAARMRMFSPQALLANLKAQPSWYLHSAGPRDLPVRQQTLQKAIEWSYNLLNVEEKALFRRLGVFAGSFTLEAVEAVCFSMDGSNGDTIELLTSLVEKNLVWRNEDEEEELRFSLFFILRSFALELLQQLGELQFYQAAHAAHYASLAEKIEPELNANDQTCWIAILERDHGNLRAALQWSISCQNIEIALRLAASLVLFWTHRNFLREGRSWIDQALSLTNAHEAPIYMHIKALRGVAWLTRLIGDQSAARDYYKQNLELCRKQGNPLEIAIAMGNLGYQIANQGDYQAGIKLLEESIALFREIGDQIGLARALVKLVVHVMNQCDYPYAKLLLEECLAINHSLNNLEGIAITMGIFGSLEYYRGNYDHAIQILEGSYERHKALGQEYYSIEALSWLALVQMHMGNLLTARKHYEEVVRSFHEIGSQTILIDALEGLAGIATKRGDMERAAKIFGAAESLRETLGYPVSPADRPILERLIDETRSMMNKDEFTKAWSDGRNLEVDGLEKVIEFALEPEDFPQKRCPRSLHTSLTARESEILRLLSQGLTDIQIAETLFISPRTVNAHLTSIYGKLGVNSRSAATRFAVENGLA
jgi:predicted ATPase/DNA-binding CsgD family transcriptional regulator/class 3 adenylate cyclase